MLHVLKRWRLLLLYQRLAVCPVLPEAIRSNCWQRQQQHHRRRCCFLLRLFAASRERPRRVTGIRAKGPRHHLPSAREPQRRSTRDRKNKQTKCDKRERGQTNPRTRGGFLLCDHPGSLLSPGCDKTLKQPREQQQHKQEQAATQHTDNSSAPETKWPRSPPSLSRGAPESSGGRLAAPANGPGRRPASSSSPRGAAPRWRPSLGHSPPQLASRRPEEWGGGGVKQS